MVILWVAKETDTMNALALLFALYIGPVLAAHALHAVGRKAPATR